VRGSITQLLRKRGYGFILGEDGCEVYFDRASFGRLDISGLSIGLWVEYDIQYGFERMRAVNVKPLVERVENAGDASGGPFL
jgi:cold shock CspA family protein